MSRSAYVLLGLTAIVAALVALVVFALLRFAEAARQAKRNIRDAGNNTTFMAAALQDALAKLRAQERASTARAEASERLSGEIVASLTAGLLVTALDGQVRILNPAGRRLLGRPDTEPSGDYRDVLGDANPLADVIEECLATGQPIVRRAIEMPEPRRGASHLGVTVSPLFDGQGQLHGVICLFTDLSAVVELEEKLRLKDSLAKLGELTAGIAHEFRNGLATIHGYGRLLDPDALPPAYRPYVEGIRQETGALGEVVTNFLNFARPAQLTLTPVDLRAIAERAAEDIQTEARGHGVDVELLGEFAVVEGDEVLLRQAFSNLLRNAAEACAGAAIAPRIVIEGQLDRVHGLARIAVTDNGPGIDPSVRDRIFRPFFTTKTQGTGLGLALVQKIVVTHNGHVTAGTAPRGGASLQVTLPLSATR